MTKHSASKRIALLYDCPYPFTQGGGQKRLFEVVSFLAEHGYEIDWYALKFWEGPDEIVLNTIRYISVGKAIKLYKANGRRSLSEALYYAFRLAFKLPRKKYDFIYAGQFPYFHLYIAKLYCLLSRAQLVIDWWEVWGKDWKAYASKAYLLGQFLEWFSCKLSRHVIAICNQGKKDLIKLGVSAQNISVIHNGMNFEQIQNLQASTDNVDLVYMGRLATHKNANHLVYATQLLKEKGILVKTSIIGGGPEFDNIDKLIKELKLENQIKLYGTIPDQNEAFAKLKAAKIFVLASTKEAGASIVALEANACGLPVVAYRHPCGLDPELIQEGVNGYWVEGSQPEDLIPTLEKLLTLGAVRKEIVKAHAQQFDWQHLAKQYLTYFESI